MKKKSILSIVLSLTIVASIFSLSALSASALPSASKCELKVTNVKDGTTATAQQLVWNSPGGSTKWELYLGTRASNSVSPRWRVKTELSTTDSGAKYIGGSDSKYYYNINTSALHKHWDAYGVDKSIKTPRLQGGTRYCYQIKCIMPDGSHKWSNVASLTFLPSVRITAVDNEKIFTATDRGGTGIEFAYKAGTDKQYTYKQFTFTNNDNLMLSTMNRYDIETNKVGVKNSSGYRIQARQYTVLSNGSKEYGAWSSTFKKAA